MTQASSGHHHNTHPSPCLDRWLHEEFPDNTWTKNCTSTVITTAEAYRAIVGRPPTLTPKQQQLISSNKCNLINEFQELHTSGVRPTIKQIQHLNLSIALKVITNTPCPLCGNRMSPTHLFIDGCPQTTLWLPHIDSHIPAYQHTLIRQYTIWRAYCKVQYDKIPITTAITEANKIYTTELARYLKLADIRKKLKLKALSQESDAPYDSDDI